MVRQAVAVGGSGSSYVYGFVDSNYKPGLSKDQCLELAAAGERCCTPVSPPRLTPPSVCLSVCSAVSGHGEGRLQRGGHQAGQHL